MRPVDADAIKLSKGFFENVNNVPKFYEWLNTLPTIDPVKHGKWISVPNKKNRICSICEGDEPYKFADENVNVFAYCPYCGTRMDGE